MKILTPEEVDRLEAELLTAPSLYESSRAADLIATVRALREEVSRLSYLDSLADEDSGLRLENEKLRATLDRAQSKCFRNRNL